MSEFAAQVQCHCIVDTEGHLWSPGDGCTRSPVPEPSPAEKSVRERVAEALLITVLGTDDRDLLTDCDLPADEIARLIVEYGADAAIAVLSGPSSDAERAVERVRALADFHAECCQYVDVRAIRAAVAGPSC